MHAHIVMSDGKLDPEFFSIHMGLIAIVTSYEDGDITLEEAQALRDELRKTKLVENLPHGLDEALLILHAAGVMEIDHAEPTTEERRYRLKMDKDDNRRTCAIFVGPCGVSYRRKPMYSKNEALKTMNAAILQGYLPRDARKGLEADIGKLDLPDEE
jgi:hypothetical protein